MRKIKLDNPKSYLEAGNQLLDIINLNNIQTSNLNNFIRNVIPRYMNQTIDGNYFTLSFEDWYLDNANVPSDKRCISQKLTREVSLMAMVNISFKNFEIKGESAFEDITYTVPVELTRIPILSEQGSFIIKGVDRVMVSHLEDANGLNVTKDNEKDTIDMFLSTSIGRNLKLSRDKDKKFTITLPKDPMSKHKGSRRYYKQTETYNLYNYLRSVGVDNIFQFQNIVGNNPVMMDEYKLSSENINGIEDLKNVRLATTERERLNRRLSFAVRLTGKELAEEVVAGDITYPEGYKVNLEEATQIQNAGIVRVKIKSPLGDFPLINNGFVNAGNLFTNEKDIPEMFCHYDTEAENDKEIRNYHSLSKTEFDHVVNTVKEEGLDLKSYLKVNYNNLVGGYVLKEDLIAMVNLLSYVEVGFEDGDDRDSLSNKALTNISTIFETLLARYIFGTGHDVGNTLVDKITRNLETYRMQRAHDSRFKLSNLDVEDTLTITANLLRNPLNKLFHVESNLNPMDEISHRRRISLIKVEGRGGIDAQRSLPVPRSVNPSHMGRICPIESPEGENIGLVLNLAALARVNDFDMLEAPFFRIDKESMTIDYSTVYYMTYDEEQTFSRAIVPQISDKDECYVALYKKGVEVDRIDLLPVYQYEGSKRVLMNRESLEEQAKDLLEENRDIADSYKLNVHQKDWFKSELVDCIVGNGELHRLKWDEIDFVTCRGEHIFSVVGNVLPFAEHNDGTRLMMGISMSKQTEPTIKSEEPLIKTPLSTLLGKESMGIVKSPVDGVITNVNSKYITLVPIVDNTDGDKNEEEKELIIPLEQCKISSEFTKISNIPSVKTGDIVLKGDVLAGSEASRGGELTTGNNLVVAYMPWEGYNFEDAIVISDRLVRENVLTSYRVNEYEFEFNKEFDYKISDPQVAGQREEQAFRAVSTEDGIIKIGTKVKTNDTLAVKYTQFRSGEDPKIKLLKYTEIDEGIVTSVIPYEQGKDIIKYSIQITTKEKIKIGDKLAGRHGNKGVIGKILPAWEMPYLEDGTQIDIILTLLGIPSRMNIGQLLESQLGLMLKEANLQVVSYPGMNVDVPRVKALLNNYVGDEEGKLQLYDGRTGKPFIEKTNVGVTTINKLSHLSAHKVSARSWGNRTQYDSDGQATKGKKKKGGQRMGEMEMWVLESHGASACAKELFTYKSDDVSNRKIFRRSVKNNTVDRLDFKQNFTNSYRRVISYIQSMGIDVEHLNGEGEVVDLYKDVSTPAARARYTKTLVEERPRIDRGKKARDRMEEISSLMDQETSADDVLSDVLGLDFGDDIIIPTKEEMDKTMTIEDGIEEFDDLEELLKKDSEIAHDLDLDNIMEAEEKIQRISDLEEMEAFASEIETDIDEEPNMFSDDVSEEEEDEEELDGELLSYDTLTEEDIDSANKELKDMSMAAEDDIIDDTKLDDYIEEQGELTDEEFVKRELEERKSDKEEDASMTVDISADAFAKLKDIDLTESAMDMYEETEDSDYGDYQYEGGSFYDDYNLDDDDYDEYGDIAEEYGFDDDYDSFERINKRKRFQ